MIRFEQVSFTYADAPAPTLRGIDLVIPDGELCLVVGATGAGKSTFLQLLNGLAPRFTGGTLAGRVVIDGRSTADHPPRELADVVGYVGQRPAAGFVTDTVEHELAFVMENLGVPPAAMRRRVEDVLDLLNLHPIRERPLETLSGGQQQRVAIGSVLTASPRVLVLDEPTSALDPAAAEDVLAALARLVHDLGVTVVAAEHRLERVVHLADRALAIDADGTVRSGPVGEVLAGTAMAPPVVRLGELAGWAPLPLSVRDARRAAGAAVAPASPSLRDRLEANGSATHRRAPRPAGAVVASVRGVRATYGPVVALEQVDLDIRAGQVVAVMGRNGSGKSTLLALLAGLRAPARGEVLVAGHRAGDDPRAAALVPQDPLVLLFESTVGAECAAADRDAGAATGTTRALLDRLLPGVPDDRHPRDLSEGQRLALALAVVLAGDPAVVLLDEPTRGLDAAAKRRLIEILDELVTEGRAVVLATHDVEVVADVADRAVVLAAGEVVADDEARTVVCHSPVFAPQVAKVLAPDEWLTVDEVRAALGVAP